VQTAVPVWTLIVVALISALAAIAGAIAGPLVQRRTTSDEANRARARLRLEKAEEIYVEMDRVQFELGKLTAAALHLMDPSRDRAIEPAIISLGRLRGLIAIYFPEGNAIFAEFDKEEVGRVVELRETLEAATAKANAKAVTGVGIARMLTHQADITDLLKQLREFMDAQAASLPNEMVFR
jgi:hypothetical protein